MVEVERERERERQTHTTREEHELQRKLESCGLISILPVFNMQYSSSST